MISASGHVLDCANIYAMSFDSLSWMVLAEMQRRKHNGPPPLRIKFANVDKIAESRKQWNLSDSREQWIDKVLRPLLPLLGAVEDDTVEPGPFQAAFDTPEHVHKAISDAAFMGYEVPRLSVGPPIDRHGKVTITLRECEHWPHRNSNVPAWVKFAKHLRDHGEEIIFVRDTDKADEAIDGFATDPEAARSIQARMKLYEGAKMNFFVSNGPHMLTVFSHAPYICLMTQFAGMRGTLGWPWLGKDQQIFFERDTLENLMKHWRVK